MYLCNLDIGNRALQYCGLPPILDVTEDSQRNTETANAYDKIRRAELQRNLWRTSIRTAILRAIDTTTMLLVPAAWSASTTYLPGAIVSDSNGEIWLSNAEDNLNNTPGDTGIWDKYFGPLTVSLYDDDTTYYAGELVYKAGAVAGSYAVFMSLTSANDDVPSTATAWDATVTYVGDQVVASGGFQWRSLIEVNLNITPAVGPNAYDATATYSAAQTVTGSDHFIYSSVGSGNIGHDPVTDGGVHWTNTNVANAWAKTPTIPVSSVNWRPIAATIKNMLFTYPIGTGPSSQSTTRNVYRLPANYLRPAPQDPKAGSSSALGAPSARGYDDWNYEGNYLISGEVGPILFRFGADVTDVQSFGDMLCEGLALRVAIEVCEALTQSATKLQTIASAYKLFMSEARMANSIELGPVEAPLDDYITCRA